jgi:hypothetical protein
MDEVQAPSNPESTIFKEALSTSSGFCADSNIRVYRSRYVRVRGLAFFEAMMTAVVMNIEAQAVSPQH